MSIKVLMTGGDGFFGSRIKFMLESQGAEVIAPDIDEMNLHHCESIQQALEGVKPGIFLHSAAYYGGLGICTQEPLRLFWDNTLMAANIFKALDRTDIKLRKMVVIGSACAYPGGVDGDMAEDEFWSDELHPSVESYGFVKKINLVGQRSLERGKGTPYAHPIITNLYGPGDVFTEYRSHVAAALIKRFSDAKREGRESIEIWGTGSPVREFIYVDDAAEAVAKVTLGDFTGIINVGTGIGTSIKELAQTIKELMGYSGEIRWNTDKPDGIARKVLDITRMKAELKWEPKHSLREGLKKTIEWYEANKEEADKRQ